MESELDLSRLDGLRDLLGAEPPEIVATLLRELGVAVTEIDRAFPAGDMAATALAAHAARNSALMIDARPMLRALGALETSARAGDGEAATAAHEQLHERWPALRRRLQEFSELDG